jgi:hypothetical protein
MHYCSKKSACMIISTSSSCALHCVRSSDFWFCTLITTPSVSFYLSLDSINLHYPAKNKKKRRE